VNEALLVGLDEVVVAGFRGVTDAAELAAAELCGEVVGCVASLEVFTDKTCCGVGLAAGWTLDLGFELWPDNNAVTIIAATKTPALTRLARSTLNRTFLEDFGAAGTAFGGSAISGLESSRGRTARV
jgi:hypothetical protein